ncbi:MAG: VanW family protein [Christensenellales bacterium]
MLRARVVVPLSGSAAAQENAALAAAQFQNVRLEAGERLSFSQTVGLRTDESGYVQAEEPAYGQDISGIGGGVCQVSTALYRPLLGGLEVAERSAAVYPFPIARRGRAAVSDQGWIWSLSTIRRRRCS